MNFANGLDYGQQPLNINSYNYSFSFPTRYNVDQANQNNQQGFDAEIDASDLFCPLPVLRAKQALDQMSADAVLKLIATDPATEKDIEVFVDQAGYELIDNEHENDTFIFYIQKTTI